jgi:hypothetical protein
LELFSEELKKAQKIRRNRLEYDALAKVVKEYPGGDLIKLLFFVSEGVAKFPSNVI